MKFHDITRPLHAALAPWPGDTPFDYRLTWRMEAGASVNVGALTMGTHNGTHADAPYHFLPDGARIDALDPAIYVGPALLVDVSRAGWTIGREALPALPEGVSRLLLRTGAWPDGARFPARIPTLAPDLPAWLGAQGVRLLGLDLPSVDAIESQDLPIHHALAAAGVHILESLDLSGVPPGPYELIALPLRITSGDAAPVRAVLRSRVTECPLLSAAPPAYVSTSGMTLDELKREAAVLSSEERLRLSAFLKRLERVDTAANRAELSRLDGTINAGDCITLEQWRKMHAALQAEEL